MDMQRQWWRTAIPPLTNVGLVELPTFTNALAGLANIESSAFTSKLAGLASLQSSAVTDALRGLANIESSTFTSKLAGLASLQSSAVTDALRGIASIDSSAFINKLGVPNLFADNLAGPSLGSNSLSTPDYFGLLPIQGHVFNREKGSSISQLVNQPSPDPDLSRLRNQIRPRRS